MPRNYIYNKVRKQVKWLMLFCLLAFFPLSLSAQTFTLTGRVIDEENNPIELANVSCAKQ